MRLVLVGLCSAALTCSLGCDRARSPTAPTASTGALAAGTPAPPPTLAAAASIYVSPAGNNGADGRAPGTAVRTIARALAIVTSGETVRVMPGTYVESIRATLRGQPGRPIRIVGEGGRPVLSGDRRLATGLWLEDSANVDIEGIELRDYSDIGLVVVLSDQIAMRDLTLHGNGYAATIGWVEGYGVHLDDSSNLTFE